MVEVGNSNGATTGSDIGFRRSVRGPGANFPHLASSPDGEPRPRLRRNAINSVGYRYEITQLSTLSFTTQGTGIGNGDVAIARPPTQGRSEDIPC